MAKILFKHYVWLIDKLAKRPMSLTELCDSYERSSLYEFGHPLQPRTLYNWREKIDELFGLQIDYTGDKYRLKNLDALVDDSPLRWLLQSLSVNDVVKRSEKIRPRILLESIPSGDIFLTDIIEAMEDGKMIRMTYRRFSDAEEQKPIEVEPYCVKVNKRRWYVLCHFPDSHTTKEQPYGGLAIYALDRIQELEITERSFTFPEDFSPEAFFSNHFGVCIGYDIPLQRILVRFDGDSRKYLRTLPLHHSQREIQTNDEYSIFEFRLHATIDFVNALLAFGADAEVLEPKELREVMATEASVMDEFYHENQEKE